MVRQPQRHCQWSWRTQNWAINKTRRLALHIPAIKLNIGTIRLEAPNYYTKLPPHVMITLIKRMVRRMCNGTVAAEMLSMESVDDEAGYYKKTRCLILLIPVIKLNIGITDFK